MMGAPAARARTLSFAMATAGRRAPARTARASGNVNSEIRSNMSRAVSRLRFRPAIVDPPTSLGAQASGCVHGSRLRSAAGTLTFEQGLAERASRLRDYDHGYSIS